MDDQEPDIIVNAEHIPEEVMEQSYAELYRNIEHWVRQSEGITNVPKPQAIEDINISSEEDPEKTELI